jgi:hypothetical protein
MSWWWLWGLRRDVRGVAPRLPARVLGQLMRGRQGWGGAGRSPRLPGRFPAHFPGFVRVPPRYGGNLPSMALVLGVVMFALVMGVTQGGTRVRWVTPGWLWEVAGDVDRADCLSSAITYCVSPRPG